MTKKQVHSGNSGSILCVIDFSDASRDALQYAIDMAASLDTRVCALYPYRLTNLAPQDDVARAKSSLDLGASQDFIKLRNSLPTTPAVAVEFRSEVGFINDRVYAYLKLNPQVVIVSASLADTNVEAMHDMYDTLLVPLLVVPGDKNKSELYNPQKV